MEDGSGVGVVRVFHQSVCLMVQLMLLALLKLKGETCSKGAQEDMGCIKIQSQE